MAKLASSGRFSAKKKRVRRGQWVPGFGYVVMPNLLVFVTAGWREAHFNSMNLPLFEGPPITASVGAHTYSGWFLGTGYEYGLKWFPGLFWKTEYRFAEYKAANLPLFAEGNIGLIGSPELNSKKFEQTLRSELVWRFNWFGKGVPY